MKPAQLHIVISLLAASSLLGLYLVDAKWNLTGSRPPKHEDAKSHAGRILQAIKGSLLSLKLRSEELLIKMGLINLNRLNRSIRQTPSGSELKWP